MSESFLHSPMECDSFRLFHPLQFSHKRIFGIYFNKLRYRWWTNNPFISGDSIAQLTDYIAYGKFKNKKLDIPRLQNARSVFVYGDLLNQFLEEGGQYITATTLVTGNSDTNFVQPITLPPSIKLWLCQNNAMPKREGLYTLPIGIENIKLGRAGLPKYFKSHYPDAIVNKVLVPPMSPTNKFRSHAVLTAMERPQIFHVERQMLPEAKYFDLTRRYRFILACEGNGFENHRIWETLYQGSFPVLVKTSWSLSLSYLNLPILYVADLKDITDELLYEFAANNARFVPENAECLWTPYWKSLITNSRFVVPRIHA